MKLTILAFVVNLFCLAGLLWSRNLIAAMWSFDALIWTGLVLAIEATQ